MPPTLSNRVTDPSSSPFLNRSKNLPIASLRPSNILISGSVYLEIFCAFSEIQSKAIIKYFDIKSYIFSNTPKSFSNNVLLSSTSFSTSLSFLNAAFNFSLNSSIALETFSNAVENESAKGVNFSDLN